MFISTKKYLLNLNPNFSDKKSINKINNLNEKEVLEYNGFV